MRRLKYLPVSFVGSVSNVLINCPFAVTRNFQAVGGAPTQNFDRGSSPASPSSALRRRQGGATPTKSAKPTWLGGRGRTFGLPNADN
ncbi:MAG: hypothetical protein IJ995_04065 [Clostridia bacterium]|nr:hypothetical protein [Clostridia bacterium]